MTQTPTLTRAPTSRTMVLPNAQRKESESVYIFREEEKKEEGKTGDANLGSEIQSQEKEKQKRGGGASRKAGVGFLLPLFYVLSLPFSVSCGEKVEVTSDGEEDRERRRQMRNGHPLLYHVGGSSQFLGAPLVVLALPRALMKFIFMKLCQKEINFKYIWALACILIKTNKVFKMKLIILVI